MDWIIQLIEEYPFLLLLVGFWVLSMVGGAITKAARKAKQQQRGQQQRGQQRRPLSPQPGQAQTRELRAPSRPARPTAEEVAAEIRRVMGMEEAPRPVVQEPIQPPPQPPPHVESLHTPEAGFEHFAEEVGGLQPNVDPHVGEEVSQRHVPSSRVTPRRELGTLGGRVHRAKPKTFRERMRRFNLDDPAAVMVTLEILGPPRALREYEM